MWKNVEEKVKVRGTVGEIGVEVLSELYVVVMGQSGIKLGTLGPGTEWDMALGRASSSLIRAKPCKHQQLGCRGRAYGQARTEDAWYKGTSVAGTSVPPGGRDAGRRGLVHLDRGCSTFLTNIDFLTPGAALVPSQDLNIRHLSFQPLCK
jgi:hypothetical protein